MAVINSAGTYGPFALAIKAGSSAFRKLDQSREALTESTGQLDRAEISREAAKLAADSRPSQLVQVLSSATGRTEARISTMRELAPPADSVGSAAKFKGTSSLVDSRAANAARVRSIDLTVGGPNSAGALNGAPIFKLPEPKPEDTQLGRAKMTQAQNEERAKAIAEARLAARNAVERLQNAGGLGAGAPEKGLRGVEPLGARAPFETKPGAGGAGGFVKGPGALDAAPRADDFAPPEKAARNERPEEERDKRRNDEAEAQNQRRQPAVPGAFNAPPGTTLNYLA